MLQSARYGQLYLPALALIAASVTIWNQFVLFSPGGYVAYGWFCFLTACFLAFQARRNGHSAFFAVLAQMPICYGIDLALGIAMTLRILPTRPLLMFRSTLPGAFPPQFLFIVLGALLLGAFLSTRIGVVAADLTKKFRSAA